MAPKPPPKAKAAKNKEPASSSETKTDSARSEQKKPSSAGAAKEKKKEKKKKKVKKAEELPRTEVSLEIIPESPEGPTAKEPAAEEVAARQNLAASLLCRAWKRTLKIRCKLIREGKLAVILVANLGTGGIKLPKGKPKELVRQKHIHTTVNHAGQRATFLIANEYGWGSQSGPGGKDDIQEKLGLTLTTRLPTETPPTLHGSPSSCWCYAEQEQVSGPAKFTSKPGYESTSCQNFIATRHTFACCPPDPSSEILHPGAFLLEKMSKKFYEDVDLPAQAYGGRFVCCKAKWVDKRHVDWPHAGAAAAAERQPSHFLLATWHGPNTDSSGLECLEKLCSHLKSTCDASKASADDCLGCVLAGDFNLDLHQLELGKYVGFERLDPDKNVYENGCRTEHPHPTRLRKQEWSTKEVAQWAGRRRYGKDNRDPQHDIDHMLFYRPPGSPLEARRPRRFRMYDRQRAGLLPMRRECRDAGHCSCSQEATPPDQRCAGAVTDVHDGALDHDSLILELWLDGTTTDAPAP